jgi:formylglycine-generating enzyme required for sulfatase activity
MKFTIHHPAVRTALAAILCCALGGALGETSSVIDPTEAIEPQKAPVAVPKKAAAPEATVKRERQRIEAEQRRRARAEAAEKERARLRALEQARLSEAAAREAAAKKAAAIKAEVARAAARATARLVAQQTAAREAAEREAAAKEIAAREAAAREAAARELAAREAAAREAAAREAAAREAAARVAAAKEVTERLIAARQASARDNGVKLIATSEAGREPRMLKGLPRLGSVFRDCAGCPELVWLPQGQFALGDASVEGAARPKVTIQYALAVGRFEVTFIEWDACVSDGGCRRRPNDAGWGRGWQPVINVSWIDAQQYVAWLSRKTNRRYRLLTEAEWEYAARAGTDARYWWGDQPGRGDANCADCGSRWDGRQAAPVGRFAPNPFGLYDMHGNVAEWVEDCYHDRLREAPVDGRAWTSACSASADSRMLRGGAWHGSARSMRSSFRTSAALDHFDNGIGFRVARSE